MFNKKSFFAFLLILVLGCSALYFYLQHRLENVVAKSFDVSKDDIIKSGFPFKLKYKYAKDKEKSFRLNLSILDKRATLYLPMKIDDMVRMRLRNVSIGEVEYFSLSAKFNSYTDLLAAKSMDFIKAFNMTNDYIMNIGFITEDPEFRNNTHIELQLPGKRQYQDFDDLMKDVPEKFIIEYKNIEEPANDFTKWPFLAKLSKVIYPETSTYLIKGSIPKGTNVLDRSIKSVLKLLANVNLKIEVSADSESVRTQTNADLHSKDGALSLELNMKEHHIKNFIQDLYQSTNADELHEFILLYLRGIGKQISDDQKNKIKSLVQLLIAKTDDKIAQDQSYFEKYSGFKSEAALSLSTAFAPNTKDTELSLKLSDNKKLLDLRLNANISGQMPAFQAKGNFYIDSAKPIADIMNIMRYAIFAFNKTIKLEEYNVLLDSYDKDAEFIASELQRMSDEPSKDSLEYTFDFAVLNPMDGSISKSKATLKDLSIFLNSVFKEPSIKAEESAE